ncbi:MAG: nucleotidyl transferase AbiEii/AbiGii toxin family protein [Armatimonadota bacterium]
MHPKVLSADAWATVRRLAAQGRLESWTLAGGTALALQIGHRYSEDVDFFRAEPFDPERLAGELAAIGPVKVQSRTSDTLHLLLTGLRISFLRAQAPLLFPGVPYRRLTVADPRDIAVMKLIAIGGRGSRRDFVDLYFCLQAGIDLGGIFSLLRRRFAEVDYNEYHLLKSLVYFEDAESEPMPRMIREIEWETIKGGIVEEVRRLSDGSREG